MIHYNYYLLNCELAIFWAFLLFHVHFHVSDGDSDRIPMNLTFVDRNLFAVICHVSLN